MTETLPWPIQHIAEWVPAWKAAGFFFATFILEDVAAIGAGLLLASGSISWPAAFISCFTGIWLGDVGLYAVARWGGRRWFEKSSLKRFSGKVAESEAWFASRGVSILVFSRFVPGARLPTYLAAGFLRVPWHRFLLVTGLASLVWTGVILWLARTIGRRLLDWTGAYKQTGLLLIATAVFAFALIRLLRSAAGRLDWENASTRIARLRRWEFWPAWMFYPPVAGYCLWLAVKHRGLGLPTVANPGIFSGGLVGESKFVLLKELMESSPSFTATSELIAGGNSAGRRNELDAAIRRLGLTLPFILKPDVGQRGAGVKLIRNILQAKSYLDQTSADLVVQRYEPGPFEVGVFYYRFPAEKHGRIFAITEKVFPTLVGDGKRTLEELIRHDERARFMTRTYLRRFGERARSVPANGESIRLVEAGNHAQGCIFRDGMHLCTPELTACIDAVAQRLNGFNIGRFDIRYSSEADLRAGRNFAIVELNGAASEATSIYDSRNSLWHAYRTLFQQWDLVFAMGAANRQLGHQPTSPRAVWRAWRKYSRIAETYPPAD